MSERPEPAAPDPRPDSRYSEPRLPPNPSVGELMTEIDRARARAARTTHILLDRVDPRRRSRQAAKRHAQALRLDGRRLAADLRDVKDKALDAVPEPVTGGVRTATRLARRVPAPIPVTVPLGFLALLLLVWRWRRSRQRNG